jgi:hypothetical protein
MRLITGTHSASTRYTELCDLPSGSGLWDASYGATGTIQRMRIACCYIQLVQAFYEEGLATKKDARNLWWNLWKHLGFSLLALLGSHKRAARKAVELYCYVILRTTTLCLTPDSPECLMLLPDLL